MESFAISVDPTIRYQIFTLTVEPDGHPLRARMELRYLNQSKTWYLSIFDASSGEAVCRYVPLVASYGELNDLMKPFRHKNVGSIYCIPVVRYPQTTNPMLETLGEFEIVWGDTDDS